MRRQARGVSLLRFVMNQVVGCRWKTVARTWPASPEIAMLQLDVRRERKPAS